MFLLGGTSDDNLFQLTSPDLQKELDRLADNGGNYVRCTMSSRDANDAYPVQQDAATQKYDFEQWNPDYWRRFETFLKETQDRDIIVQIEMWVTCDFYSRSSRIIDGKTAWLGGIRSLFATLMVFGTATSPLLFGLLLDHGFHFSVILVFSIATGIVVSLLGSQISIQYTYAFQPSKR